MLKALKSAPHLNDKAHNSIKQRIHSTSINSINSINSKGLNTLSVINQYSP
jgi:hypothetical protein